MHVCAALVYIMYVFLCIRMMLVVIWWTCMHTITKSGISNRASSEFVMYYGTCWVGYHIAGKLGRGELGKFAAIGLL